MSRDPNNAFFAAPTILFPLFVATLSTRAARSRRPHSKTKIGIVPPPAWTVKRRHAPARHCRDARVYGHATIDMHEVERISPPIECTLHPLFAVGLVDGNPTYMLRHGIEGMRVSMAIRLRPSMRLSMRLISPHVRFPS